MSDITLTAGIRQNLLSLQQTSADLTTTQEQLATGKKVNSAADNPSSYFTSQNLTNSANSLSALLDQIGQGQQTINAATDGLTGITSLLQQALATVQQAQQASPTTAAAVTGSVAAHHRQRRRQPRAQRRCVQLHGLDHRQRVGQRDRSADQRHHRPRLLRRPDRER